MLRKMVGEKIYCGLDIGSQRIKAVILKTDERENLELLGTYAHKKNGFKDGSLSDLGEFSEGINHTINTLTQKLNVKVKEVCLGIGAYPVYVRDINALIPLVDKGNKVITARDIQKVNEQARLLGVNVDEEILHDVPQSYRVDETQGVSNPLGLAARKLGVQTMILMTRGNYIENIIRGVHQAGLDVAHLGFSSYVSSGVVLTDEEKMKGSVLVDMGAQETCVLIFKEGVLRFFTKLGLGGDILTKTIAAKLHLSFDLAEEIKKSYSSVLTADFSREEEILVKREEAYKAIKRNVLCQAIDENILQLFAGLKQAIEASGIFQDHLPAITVMGGGAFLSGFIERLSQEMKYPVHMAKLKTLSPKQIAAGTALFSSAAGLANYAYKKGLRHVFSSNTHRHWADKFTNRVKELYEEYF